MDLSTGQPSVSSDSVPERQKISRTLQPLQVESSRSVDRSTLPVHAVCKGRAEDGEPEGQDSDSEMPSELEQPLSLVQQGEITSRINELSQLHSPQLRELARRLGNFYNIQTPPAKSFSNLGGGGRHPYSDFHVGQRWQEIQGCSSWTGLLDPIDPVLRAEIVRYGEFAQACYDSFDSDRYSKYCGSCKYTKENLLEKVGLVNRGYEITEYLYATAELPFSGFLLRVHEHHKGSKNEVWSVDSNWMGFVAVCTSPQEIERLGRRDIVVAWRGTVRCFEWIQNMQDYLRPVAKAQADNRDVCVESGFLNVYQSSNANSRYNKKSARDQVRDAIKNLVAKYMHDGHKLSLTVTGHSLGSALATICGYDIAESQINSLGSSDSSTSQSCGERNVHLKLSAFRSDRIPITVYCFAGPRVGNRAFKNRMEHQGVAVLRVENKHDKVTKIPGKLFKHAAASELTTKALPFLPTYEHVGVRLKLDHTKSYYLKPNKDYKTLRHYVRSHNLEGYLHLVDGFHSSQMKFEPTLRDFALVNKRCDFLKREYYIPPKWWQEENKGLRKGADGRWEVPERDADIYPQSDEALPESNEQSENLLHNVNLAVAKSLGCTVKGLFQRFGW